jgi:hypothetical protein
MPDTSLRRFTGHLRHGWLSPRRVRFWLLVVVAVYTLVGFFVLPWVIQYVAVDTVRNRTGHQLQIEAVRTNPYTLTLRVDGLTLSDSDESPLIRWKRLSANLAWSSVINQGWTLSSVRLDGLTIAEERFASGETRLTRLMESFAGETPAESPPEPGSLPAVRVEQLRVEGAALHFAEHVGDTATDTGDGPARLSVQDIAFALDGFSLQEGARFPAQLSGQFAGGGTFAFDGRLQVLPAPALEGEAGIEALALAPFEPYLRQVAVVRIDSGTLSLDGTIRRHEGEPLAFQGSAGIDTLRISRGSDDDTLIGWQALRTGRLDLRLGDGRLETDAIQLEGLSGRVVIHEDRTTNFGRLLVADPEAAPESDSSADPGPLAITIAKIEVTDGSLRFADHSLPLPFSTNIQALSGAVSTLSSESAEPARVELEGRVDDYGLARIGGTFHAWQPMRKTNLKLIFRNLQIPEYSPYTVRFAGRRIASGTMDLDLDYTITDRQLDGSNNLVLQNLELGERMEAPDAMDLPLDMAMALLKDENGVIGIDLPVSGDMDKPEFDIGQVIRQALGNALTSIVQAPFRFLAGLVGAESDDLGKVEFPAGRSDLTPPMRERIDTLRKALQKRPALALDLAGAFDPALDGPPLRRRRATDALRKRLAEAGREVNDPGLSAESNREIVETMFASHYPDTDLDQVRARFTGTGDDSPGKATFDGLAYRNHLAERIVAAQPLADKDLEALGNARAAAVRDALMASQTDRGIAAPRLRLKDPAEVDSGDGERVAMAIGIAPE